MPDNAVIFCDNVQSVGVHNGIARIAFIRLDAAGSPSPVLELLIPVGQVASLAKALHSITRAG